MSGPPFTIIGHVIAFAVVMAVLFSALYLTESPILDTPTRSIAYTAGMLLIYVVTVRWMQRTMTP